MTVLVTSYHFFLHRAIHGNSWCKSVLRTQLSWTSMISRAGNRREVRANSPVSARVSRLQSASSKHLILYNNQLYFYERRVYSTAVAMIKNDLVKDLVCHWDKVLQLEIDRSRSYVSINAISTCGNMSTLFQKLGGPTEHYQEGSTLWTSWTY